MLKLSHDKWHWMADKNVVELKELFHENAVFVHMGGYWETERQSSDSLCPSGQVFVRLVRLKSCTGVLCVRWVQREFEDLLAVLIVSLVGGNRRLPTDRKGRGKVPSEYRKKII